MLKNDIWLDHYNILLQFLEEKKRLPKSGETYHGQHIGAWCNTQKVCYKKGKVTLEREELLRKVGLIGDATLPREEKWEYIYRLLCEFVGKEGRFPKSNEVYKGVSLGRWCANQKWKQTTRTDEQTQKLIEIGLFDLKSKEELWEKNYLLVKNYLQEHPSTPRIPQNEVYCGKKIGYWCATQRALYIEGKLCPDREEKLVAIGLITEKTASRQQKWDRNFELLKQFISENSRLPKLRELYNGTSLGAWVQNQRKMHQKGKLSPEKTQMLQEIGAVKKISNLDRELMLLKAFCENDPEA